MTGPIAADVQVRARRSRGGSSAAIHRLAAALLRDRGASGTLADIGCGTGALWAAVSGRFARCIGVDAVRYDGLPPAVDFRPADLDAARLPLADAEADAVAAVETIEHLENPRAFVRELVRITRPGGCIVITTPNQLSALSMLTLLTRGRFAAFQDVEYPAHRTALLEVDLRRIAAECGLADVEVRYTLHGRVPFTWRHYPRALARLFPRRLSDNVAIAGRAAAGGHR